MTELSRRRFILGVGAAAVAAMTTAACGRDRIAGSSTSTTDVGPTLPPGDLDALRAVFDPRVSALGVHLTRGALVDVSGAQYEPSDTGTHLALYLEPVGDRAWTVDDYVAAITPTAAAIAPYCFATWSGLDSFDVCLEAVVPQGESAAAADLPPTTQLELSRADAGLIDWSAATLADLIRAGSISPDTARLVVSGSIAAHPAYQRAGAEASSF